MTKKQIKQEQTELLDRDEPVLKAWAAIRKVLETIDAPKTRVYRKPVKSKSPQSQK
jgi:hypothetical protein